MPSHRPRLVIAPRAQQDIRAIWRFSADRWGESQADEYHGALSRGIQALHDNPCSGPSEATSRADFACTGSNVTSSTIALARRSSRLLAFFTCDGISKQNSPSPFTGFTRPPERTQDREPSFNEAQHQLLRTATAGPRF